MNKTRVACTCGYRGHVTNAAMQAGGSRLPTKATMGYIVELETYVVLHLCPLKQEHYSPGVLANSNIHKYDYIGP